MDVNGLERRLQKAEEELFESRKPFQSEKKISDSIIASLPGFYFMVDETMRVFNPRYGEWRYNRLT